MAKYHVNDEGVAGVCRASINPCKFGGPDGTKNHYENKEEAEAAADAFLKKKYASSMRSMKKQKVPTTYGPGDDLNHLDSETRANIFVFEAMKQEALIGKPQGDNFYGSGDARVDPELEQKLVAMGAVKPRNKKNGYGGTKGNREVSVKELEENGYSVKFVPGSMDYENTDHFDGSFEPSRTEAHLTARAVIHAPNGARLEVPVASKDDFMDLSSKALEIAAESKQLRAQGDITMNVVNTQVKGLKEENAALRRQLKSLEDRQGAVDYEDEDSYGDYEERDRRYI